MGTVSNINVIKVDINELRPNSWNPNQMDHEIYEKERESLEKFGYVQPITVRQVEESAGFEIIDGFHRWKLLKELGWEDVEVNTLGKISESQAKQLTLILNHLRGEPDQIMLAKLVENIQAMDADALFPFLEDELDALSAIADLSDADINPNQVGAGELEGQALENDLIPLHMELPRELYEKYVNARLKICEEGSTLKDHLTPDETAIAGLLSAWAVASGTTD